MSAFYTVGTVYCSYARYEVQCVLTLSVVGKRIRGFIVNLLCFSVTVGTILFSIMLQCAIINEHILPVSSKTTVAASLFLQSGAVS